MKQFYKDLETVVKINSYTQNKKGVDKVGKVFQNWFEEIGFQTEVFHRELIGNHLLFKSPKKEGKKILFLGHLDTVFPEGKFETYKEDEEWVYGAGVCDMKGGNMVMIEALRNLDEIYNIDIFLVSDEEIGSDDSFQFTSKLAKEYDYCLVFEAAGINDEVVISRKGIGTFYIEIEGKAAHAGNNYTNGIDANLEAAKKLIALTNLTNLSKGTTVNVGNIEGGIGANTISPKAKLSVEIRFTDPQERDRVLKELDNITLNSFVEGTLSKLYGRIQRDVMQENNKQLEFIKNIEKWTGVELPTEKRGGVSDANITASNGCITLDGFGPFGDGDHTIHERASKKSYLDRIELVTKILKGFISER